ncbi:MAG: FkbM family methyltransferase [Candidatus Micrarchaeaceae archaeon]
MANLLLPITQLSDVSSIIRHKGHASRLGGIGTAMLGSMKVSSIPARKDEGFGGFLKFRYKGRALMFYYDSKARLAQTIGMISDEFVNEESSRLNVRRKDVVDVGAYVGDTAISFIANGARHVYAFEPYPYLCRIAAINIKANRLANRITMVNAGCGAKASKTTISRNAERFTGITANGAKRGNKNIDVVALGDIVKRYNLSNAVLKLDCEGCEYGIVSKTDTAILRRFSEIQIEYHYGYRNLENRLKEAGFSVKHTKPSKKYNFTARNFMVVGFINARRK